MKRQKQVIVIVSGYFNSRYLGPAFLGRGYQCFHVRTPIDDVDCEKPSCTFTQTFDVVEDGIENIVKALKQYHIRAVVNGVEWAVMFGDKLASHFDVPKNNADSSLLRRHKFLMIDALKQAGIPCPIQFVSPDLEEILAWYQQCGHKKVVMKPTLSAFSDGVGICENNEEISQVFKANIHKKNLHGYINNEYVIQEFLVGKHYWVNTVCVNGNTFVTDIWHDINHHEGIYLIDEYMVPVSREEDVFKVLEAYIIRVLDALEIVHGPAHSEVMITDEGPKLIETGARLPGLLDFSLIEECYGFSQLSVTVDSILDPDLFVARTDLYKKNKPKQFLRLIYMYSELEGLITKEVVLDSFLKIPSLYSIQSSLTEGSKLQKTKYSLGHPGYAMLMSNNPEDLVRDYAAFRHMEKIFYNDLLCLT
jgi:hypothetical protein